jgi:hypothetical protein
MKAEPVQAFAARTRPRQNPGVLDGTIQRLPHAMDRQTASGHNDVSGLPGLASTLQIVYGGRRHRAIDERRGLRRELGRPMDSGIAATPPSRARQTRRTR